MLRRCESGLLIPFHYMLAGVDDQNEAERRIMKANALQPSTALLEV